jgi:hypothetical protein
LPPLRGAAPEGLGQAGRPLCRQRVKVPAADLYQVQLRYHNGANRINLGISGGVDGGSNRFDIYGVRRLKVK